jgi:molybdopterin-guanine dinucleotide biosynthesis protein A
VTDRVAGLVLAGGRSSRFGRDKLAEPIDGRTMLDRAIDAVGSVAAEVTVVASPKTSPPMRTGVSVVHDDLAFEGPLAGLATGLRALDPAIEQVIVVGGDMPTVVPAVLRRLLDALDAHEAAVIADEEHARPLPLAVRRSVGGPAVDRLLDDGERRLRALLDTLDVDVIPPATWRVDDPTGETLRDVDTPEDLPSPCRDG